MSSEELTAILSNQNQFNEVLRTVFEGIDTDSSGFIEQGEFFTAIKSFLTELNVTDPVTEEQTNELLSTVDKNNDGKLSRDEFGVLLRKLLESLTQA